MLFLIVGHTHDKIDRLFSRLKIALRGHDFDTVETVMKILTDGLPGFSFDWAHLSRVWDWTSLNRLDLPPFVGMSRAHALNFYRSNGGIYVKWKHYLTSEEWSRLVLIVPVHDMARVASWRPAVLDLTFKQDIRAEAHSWLNRVETSLVDVSTSTSNQLPDLQYLRDLVDSKLPQFGSTLTIDEMIFDFKNVGNVHLPKQETRGTMPPDVLVPLFPGADHPEVPADTLIRIPKRWEPPPCRVLGVDSMVICKVPPTTTISLQGAYMKLPFLLATVLDVAADKASIVVQWWVPGASPMVRYGGGKKQNKIDVFSAWTPSSYMQLGDVADSVLPNIIVDIADVLHINVDIGPGHRLPFPVLDQLRYADVVDLTALSYSQTQLGAVYRSHALMTSKSTSS